jgi:RNase P subunit RPR2
MRFMKIEKEEFRPVCPHCERPLEHLVEAKGRWYESARVVCCPHCRKVIAVAGLH